MISLVTLSKFFLHLLELNNLSFISLKSNFRTWIHVRAEGYTFEGESQIHRNPSSIALLHEKWGGIGYYCRNTLPTLCETQEFT